MGVMVLVWAPYTDNSPAIVRPIFDSVPLGSIVYGVSITQEVLDNAADHFDVYKDTASLLVDRVTRDLENA